MTGFNCLICNHLIDGISKQIVQKTEGKCQLLSTVLQQNTTATTAGSSFFDLTEFLNLWTTSGAAGCQICPECDAKLVQLDHYLEQLSSLQASIDRIQKEIREDSIKSQLARKTKIEPTAAAADHQDYFEATQFLDGPLISESLDDNNDTFNYNSDSNSNNLLDFNFDAQPIDELESKQGGNETNRPNKIVHDDVLNREAQVILEPINLPAGVLTFNLKTDQEIINYINRSQKSTKKAIGKGSVKKKKERKPKYQSKFFYPFKCDVGSCKKGFTGINYLIAHKKVHEKKNNGKYSCDYCNRTFKLIQTLAVHLMKHGIGDSQRLEKFKCTLCPTEKIFPTQFRLDSHMKCHGDSNFNSICELCGEEILGMKSKMDNHLQLKHGIGEDLVKCPKCPTDQFYKPGSKVYEIHMAHHLRLELKAQQHYVCEFCTSSFVSRPAFEEHQLRKHISPGLKAICEYEDCGQEFASKKGLLVHIRGYHKKMYTCPHCHESCPNSTRLKVHIKKHLGIRDYKCTSNGCEKSFYQAKTLREHIRSAHTLIRPFKCSYNTCCKAFSTKERVKRHELLHTGVTRFVCEFCSEGYTIKESLKIHIRSKHQNPNTIIVGNNPRKQEYTRRPKVKILQKSE